MARRLRALVSIREWLAGQRLNLAEVCFVLVALCGLALLTSVAWSLLAGGVLGAVACDRASTIRALRTKGEKPRLERVA